MTNPQEQEQKGFDIIGTIEGVLFAATLMSNLFFSSEIGIPLTRVSLLALITIGTLDIMSKRTNRNENSFIFGFFATMSGVALANGELFTGIGVPAFFGAMIGWNKIQERLHSTHNQ